MLEDAELMKILDAICTYKTHMAMFDSHPGS